MARRALAPVPPAGGRYSVNAGLWGLTIGGGELHDSSKPLPEDCWQWTRSAGASSGGGERRLELRFEMGIPVALDGAPILPVDLIETLNREAGALGVGRGYHLGDTVIGIKGRIAFEAPAASILLDAHRELEKLVLTEDQRFWKDHLGDVYGRRLHQGLFHDPFQRDLEAFFTSSQARVSGTANIKLANGAILVDGVASPFSLMAASDARYGEMVGTGMTPGARSASPTRSRGRRASIAARGYGRDGRREEGRVGKRGIRKYGIGKYGIGKREIDGGGVVRRCQLEKIASVTSRLGLDRNAVLGDEIPAVTGTVIAARVRNAKTQYNTLEDVHGRMVALHPGDVIAGALGHRDALYGYSGRVPEAVKPGDELQLLNLRWGHRHRRRGGPGIGEPFRLEVLGSVLEFPFLGTRVGRPANIARAALPQREMPAGPPADHCARRHLHGRGEDDGGERPHPGVHATRPQRGRGEAHGRFVASRRPPDGRLRRRPVAIFTDFGVVTTDESSAVPAGHSLVAHLAEAEPQLLVLEMGDGLLGTYGVQALLADEAFRRGSRRRSSARRIRSARSADANSCASATASSRRRSRGG